VHVADTIGDVPASNIGRIHAYFDPIRRQLLESQPHQ
jgi:hypothetical protein